MDFQLTGKRALVTGGSRGIGRAVARRLALEGCSVAICARTLEPLDEAARLLAAESGTPVLAVECDTRDPIAIDGLLSRVAGEFGGVDILVNCAARVGRGVPEEFDTVADDQILTDFEEKVMGYFRCARAAVPYMKEGGWGTITNIGGSSAQSPGVAMSTPTRNAAVAVMTKSMARSLGPFGINVNAIHPGPVLAEPLPSSEQPLSNAGAAAPTAITQGLRQQSRPILTAEDVAAAVVFLSSPLARGITGEAIVLSGSHQSGSALQNGASPG